MCVLVYWTLSWNACNGLINGSDASRIKILFEWKLRLVKLVKVCKWWESQVFHIQFNNYWENISARLSGCFRTDKRHHSLSYILDITNLMTYFVWQSGILLQWRFFIIRYSCFHFIEITLKLSNLKHYTACFFLIDWWVYNCRFCYELITLLIY